MTSETPESKCRHGWTLLRGGRIEDAITEFEAALRISDKPLQKGPLLYNLALAHHMKGDRHRAIEFLDRAMSTDRVVRSAIYRAKDFPELRDSPDFLALLGKYPTGTKWLALYTLLRVPLVLLLLKLLFGTHPSYLHLVLHVGLILFNATLFWGLAVRRHWAWHLVWAALSLDALLWLSFVFSPIASERTTMAAYVMPILITAMIWIWPNYVYFMKRKHLFRHRKPKAASVSDLAPSTSNTANTPARVAETHVCASMKLQRATVGDIVLSVVLPGWGVIIGVVALCKGEKRRACVMLAIGTAIIVLLALVGYL